jgi:hypothetical protein
MSISSLLQPDFMSPYILATAYWISIGKNEDTTLWKTAFLDFRGREV